MPTLELTDEQYDTLKHILKETAECPVATCDSYCAFCDHRLNMAHAREGSNEGCDSDCPEKHYETCPVLEAQELWNAVVFPIENAKVFPVAARARSEGGQEG